MNPPDSSPSPAAGSRWTFFRDVFVFQGKMMVDNARDFLLIPVSLTAALFDLLVDGGRRGTFFYQVLRWGAESEKIIDVYSPLTRSGEEKVSGAAFTIDAVVGKLESVVVREWARGGTAASVKAAMDRAAEQLRGEGGGEGERERES